ncbi:putative ribonuclease H-like domain-containing protein [Tanacetum coccineum]|uniref:Ribonuclease H-like domain-containing protein n=1 Tax=Tanacetum coccineum TaxID=301880 RepID=A0ABQ4XGC4_9ASTR
MIGLDELAIRKKIIKSKTTDLNTKTNETVGKTNAANVKSVEKPKINRDRVIIEDWNSDDENDMSDVVTTSPVRTNETQTVRTRVDKIGQVSQKSGIGFKKVKSCFVCKSTDHLIKDCNFYDKKSPEPKLRNVVNTGVLTRTGVVNPVRPKVNPVRPNVSTVRPKVNPIRLKVNPVRPKVNHVRPNISTTRSVGTIRPIYPRMDNVRPRASYSPIKRSYYTKPAFRPKDLKRDVRTFGVKNMTTAGTKAVVNTGKGKMENAFKKSRWVWRPKGNYMDHESKENRSFILKKGNPKIVLQDYAVVDSGCSSHMTSNKDYNGGFVAFALSQVVFRAPRQNDVYSLDLKNIVPSGERKNRTLIEAARTMLADSLLPIPFWAEAVNTACYVLNRVLVTKPQNKTPYELLLAKLPSISFMRPFGCPLTILNTLDPLGKFDGKADEGSSGKDKEPTLEYILHPIHPHGIRILVEDVVQAAQEKPSKNAPKDNKLVTQELVAKAMDDATRQAFEEEKRKLASQKRAAQVTSINKLNTGRPSITTANTPYVSVANTPTGTNADESSFVYLGGQIPIDASTLPNADLPTDPNMPDLEDDSDVLPTEGLFSGAYDDEGVGAEADFNNMDNTIDVSPIPTLRIHKDHPKGQILGDPKSAVQTRVKIQKASSAQQALKVWVLVYLPSGKKEEEIDYDKVFAPVARLEAIRLVLAFASYMGFTVYQMDVRSAFIYGTIGEEVYVHQPPGFVDPAHPNKVYKVTKALYGLHQAPRAWYETLYSFLLENGFRRATTPIESNKPLVKDEDGVDVDVHVYRSMIGSLMYLTTSRPGIMFADSTFELEAFSDSDYGGASLDRKSTIGGFQFLGRRLISWQCKKQSIMANSTTEAEYVAAANCCGQVLWIQNQMMDYGFNFMNTKIHIDNESTISVIKNPISHSRTKHIEIRFHFIRDCYEKRLIEVIKIHTDHNVVDLLTKGFDVSRFNFLVVNIGMMNLTCMNLRMSRSCAGSISGLLQVNSGRQKLILVCHVNTGRLKVNSGRPILILMAILKYSDKHNMVAFLKKPVGSDDFHEIVDFLKCTPLRYALTHNPTVYDSLVKQFWKTATVRTLANGTQELVASIDTKEYTITEVSVRSSLQLADSAGIQNLSDAEIHEGLATMGPKSGGWDQFGSTIATALIWEHVPLLPAMLAGASEDQGEGSAIPADPHPTPSPTTTLVADEATTISVEVEVEGATTTTIGLDAGLDSGNIHESQLRSHAAPLHEGHTSGSTEDRLQLKELMEDIPKLAVLTLVERVKLLEKALKRKTKKIVVSDSEGEEPEDQGRKIQDIDDDPLVSLVRESMKEKDTDFVTPTKTLSTYKRRVRATNKGKDISTGLDAEAEINTGSEDFNTGSIGVNTCSGPVSTPSVVQTINVIIPSPVKSQREGKAPITTEDVTPTRRTKAQIQQGKADLPEAMRLQALLDEEASKQVHLDALLAKRILEEEELSEQQKKRKAEVQKAAQFYTEEDWDTIRAKLKANAKLTKSLQGESVTGKDFAKRMVEMINQKRKYYAEQKAKARKSKPMTQAQQREYMSTFIKNQSSWKLAQLKKLTFEELKDEFEKLMKNIERFVPMESDKRVKRQVKKRGTIKKQKARKGIHVDKTAHNEEREAHIKDKVTDPSSGTDIPVSVVPVAIKPPSIANWNIIKLGKKGMYQIIREYGTYITYINFGAMLKSILIDDITELYRIVMQRYGTNRQEDECERVLWGDLKTMFDPPLSIDLVWNLPYQQKILRWRYYDTCRVHCLTLESADIYMLTERRYSIPADVCQAMLDKRLQGDKKDEACY